MFEIDVPAKGEDFLNQKLNQLHDELNSTTDAGYIKTNYRNQIQQLIHRIEDIYYRDFWAEIEWIWNHLHELEMVGDMWINDFEYQEPKPIYKGFDDLGEQFKKYIDDYYPISDVNFPLNTYKTLHSEILKAKENCLIRPEKSDQILKKAYAGRYQDLKDRFPDGQFEILYFHHERAINTLKKLHRISLTTYKERINLVAFSKALRYSPATGSRKGNKSEYGQHQEKFDWIKSEWDKVRKTVESDRQADLKIKELYSKKYNGLSISKSTIERATGRQ
ncbi:MAG: hypothetical protein JJU13_10255 [Balneolaceae bacterium]|nr:hypothetical protein [Balneolaceae bacterium]